MSDEDILTGLAEIINEITGRPTASVVASASRAQARTSVTGGDLSACSPSSVSPTRTTYEIARSKFRRTSWSRTFYTVPSEFTSGIPPRRSVS